MLDPDQVIALHDKLDDRFTAEELCEVLGLTVNDLFDAFFDKVVEINWDEYL